MIAALLLLAAAAPAEPCDNAISQSAMTMCAAEAYKRADAALNAQWKITLAKAKARDVESPPMSVAERRYADGLLDSQRAWIAFRDAQCAAESLEMRGGSAQPMLLYGCKAAMTRERTKWLKDFAAQQ
ncbi:MULTISPECIES: lysozyme inhibitor LprI family protein [unclassified Sphingomonas]|uniref:lysozyme inhibitor LprI family protein n=1 Tax=unclassified Sphingomonas TaxID=196159 RepID=UPI000BD56232|nr:MAG: hypothetical protein B7Z43_09460 [Sphingomonas sp. 12-62-6]OYX37615.1 MAG: hypothetical protein B7Y98_11245 [Sphingomonas sp. 32-62-10]OYY64529.1 MAG: hypothetical protein B7Y49_09610 [Sphingomonas sp. 28-62-11]